MTNPPTSDPHREWILGRYERGSASIDECKIALNLLSHIQPEAATMVDVGAHRGSALGPFAARGWRVFAFEPDDVNRAELIERVKPEWSVSIDTRIVSERCGERIPFYRSEESTGVSGVNPFLSSHEVVGEYESVRLDVFLQSRSVRHVDFLKVDTEGHDLSVLRGFDWAADRPDVVVCEFEDSKTNQPGLATEQAEFLYSFGYNVLVSEWHPIVRYGIAHDYLGAWLFNDGDSLDTCAWGNLLAFSNQLLPAIRLAAEKSVEESA